MGVKTKTSFSSTNQPKRRRGKSKRNELLEAMKKRGTTEIDFWENVLELADNGEMAAIGMIANRLAPPLKAESAPIPEGVIDDEWIQLSFSSKAAYITHLVASGQLSVDCGSVLTRMLDDTARAEADRMESLNTIREAEDQGDRNAKGSLKNLYELSCLFQDDIVRDINRLKELTQTGHEMSDDETDRPDTDTTNTTEDSNSEQ